MVIPGRLFHQLSVDVEIVESDILGHTCDGISIGCNAVEVAVVNVDIVDVAYFLEALDHHTIFALLACDIVEPYIFYSRGIAAVAVLVGLVDKVDFKH